MSQDQVDLDAQQVANGLAKWDQVAGTLESRWADLNGRINGLLTTETWGADEPGSNFQESFVEAEGGAGGFEAKGQVEVDKAQRAGRNARKSCEASMAADQEQASKVGGVAVPGFGSGGG